MTKEECLEIIKKLDDISKNKFYTINVWDTTANAYFGDVEYYTKLSNEKVLLNNYMSTDSKIITLTYRFHTNGTYERVRTVHGKLSDILSRLDALEQKLN